jgi:tRNA pseudouridine38-40 synthase
MPRYRALLAYDGTPFHGFQFNKGVETVEGVLTEAFSKFTRGNRKIQGASRTDAGVHAEGQVIHFDYVGSMNPYQLARAFNGLTPRSIRVVLCEEVDSSFHARHDAWGKRYSYSIWNHPVQHPLYLKQLTFYPWKLDIGKMRQAAEHFLGEHDFSCLRASGCGAISPVRCLERLQLNVKGPLLHWTVDGTAFLKYMVRNLMGTLLEVGRGKRHPDSIPELILSRNRAFAGSTASPSGLKLVYIRYPEHPWEDGRIYKTFAFSENWLDED